MMRNRFTTWAGSLEIKHSPLQKSLCLVLTLSMFLAGCGDLPVVPERNPAETPRPDPTTLAVVPARFEPKGNSGPLMRTKGGSAAKGASEGAASGLASSMMVGDPLLAVIMLPVMVPLGIIAGAAGGTSAGFAPDAIENSARAWEQAIREAHLQQRLRDQFVAELQRESVAKQILVNDDLGPTTPDDKPRYDKIGADTVLEVGLLEMRFYPAEEKGNAETTYGLVITVRAKVIETKSQSVLDEMKYVVGSPPHSATDWLRDNATLFTSNVDVAMKKSAAAIVLEFFRLYYPPESTGITRQGLYGAPNYVLQPEYPQPLKWHRSTQLTGNLQPAFRWESFPRAIDLQGTDSQADRFSDVTYDFALYSATANKTPFSEHLWCALKQGMGCTVKPPYTMGPRIYLRTDLPVPQHRLEIPLQPCSYYAWTIRAHFRLDGHQRQTEWSGSYLSPPWRVRRTYNIGIEPWFLFRAPPADEATACPD